MIYVMMLVKRVILHICNKHHSITHGQACIFLAIKSSFFLLEKGILSLTGDHHTKCLCFSPELIDISASVGITVVSIQFYIGLDKQIFSA